MRLPLPWEVMSAESSAPNMSSTEYWRKCASDLTQTKFTTQIAMNNLSDSFTSPWSDTSSKQLQLTTGACMWYHITMFSTQRITNAFANGFHYNMVRHSLTQLQVTTGVCLWSETHWLRIRPGMCNRISLIASNYTRMYFDPRHTPRDIFGKYCVVRVGNKNRFGKSAQALWDIGPKAYAKGSFKGILLLQLCLHKSFQQSMRSVQISPLRQAHIEPCHINAMDQAEVVKRFEWY